MSVLRRITTLAATALIATASFTGGATAASASAAHKIRPAETGASDSGTGPTLAAAKVNARINLNVDNGGGCLDLIYYADGQYSDGTWWADVSGECNGGGYAASAAARPYVQAHARPDTVAGYGYGTGATALAAEHAADVALRGDYLGEQQSSSSTVSR